MGWRIKLENIRDVAEYQLCCGCGACAYISPYEIEMVDTLEYGRRPLLREGGPRDPRSAEAMRVCPGIELRHTFDRRDAGLIRELTDEWGPVREVWEGHAADPEIRFAGSSGGAATALALFCVEKLGYYGVLHIAARPDVPYLNRTVLSRTRAELLAATGSRYAPASPCDGLQMIEEAPGPCVFIGKPCDVAAVEKARRLRPGLDAKVGLTIAIFCAGTPSTAGTLALLRRLGVGDPGALGGLRYRGNGWPGEATATWQDNGTARRAALPYEESWGMLTKYVQWRCRLCPDHTGEFGDIAVGDPWYRKPGLAEPGSSLILARTPVGARVLHAAGEDGAVELLRSDPGLLPASQPNLLRGRAAVWGRLAALRVAGAPRPTFRSLNLFSGWLRHLTLAQKCWCLLGTFRRIARRGVMHSLPVVRGEGPTSEPLRQRREAAASPLTAAEPVYEVTRGRKQVRLF